MLKNDSCKMYITITRRFFYNTYVDIKNLEIEKVI